MADSRNLKEIFVAAESEESAIEMAMRVESSEDAAGWNEDKTEWWDNDNIGTNMMYYTVEDVCLVDENDVEVLGKYLNFFTAPGFW